MTAASKLRTLLKLHYRDNSTCRTSFSCREAEVLGEEMGICIQETWRGMGPGDYTRIAEIMLGRAISQQGLAITCKDPLTKETNQGDGRDLV